MLVTIKSLLLYGAFVSGNGNLVGINDNNFGGNGIESMKEHQYDSNIKQGYELLSKASYAEEVDGYYEKAAELKKQACDLGIGKACWYYAFQTNKDADYARAADVLQKSCFNYDEPPSALVGESCTYLGIMQSQGKVETDYSEANLYEMGCDLNDGWGCYRLARDFVAQDDYDTAAALNEKAIRILDTQCNENIGSSCYLLGSIYEQPFSDTWLDSNTRENHSKIFFERGCKLRDGDACSSL
ncbi:hypothetical protein DCO58_03695 [Helicobacter saguini]|uniref:Beta-lactamase n=1 Tax=Helicobacter saguini TaxID=1548018 RepID=A0A347VSF2_9HELI|nr:tetratricopeptide repeat protein [Helicobacter saguini]MWV62533.1 hypothetical protein [Helicobacter saguini]MWV66793.1 hypothetical protein [Helicobacter saguini]MWV69144.1 hypothetical protein [Helicobacter saguini]MWV71301.1 hypothetical protein [Helicobacter saguini]TLD94188.1 sel1 repeat family protein [Helicobacter saguini]